LLGFEVASRTTGTYPDVVAEWKDCPAVEQASKPVGGAWIFTGTRIPARALFGQLAEGGSIDDFLHRFPGVTPEQVVAVPAHVRRTLTIA
jgi:uncharacterized protein (DUF433 family)